MIESPLLKALPGLAHGFFTRQGGVSGGLYAGLNCGFGSGDDEQAVAQNREHVRQALGADALVTAYQVHSATVHRVTRAWPREQTPQGDAMVTDVSGIALGILTADCAPILFADAEAGVIGAAHAGWKGAFLGVAAATVEAMQALGARRERIAAAVGPCLALESFEVGPEFIDRFTAQAPEWARYFETRAGWAKPHFDLGAFVADRLQAAGVNQPASMAIDTYADEDRFFSYRRSCHRGEPDYGRQISAIMLR
jgi:YfiH family protein